jgi:hypothetical protein
VYSRAQRGIALFSGRQQTIWELSGSFLQVIPVSFDAPAKIQLILPCISPYLLHAMVP